MVWFFSALYTFVPAAVVGYLCGCINWAIILTRIFKNNEDIRKMGSGNAGMTNVLRSVGKLPAVLTFAGDFLKCVAACLLARLVLFLLFGEGYGGPFDDRTIYLVAGAFCVLGHLFPVFYRFEGGKGIVTSSALMLMTDWRLFLLILLTFGVVFLWKRIISLGSVVCAALYPVYMFFFTFFFGLPVFFDLPARRASTAYLIFAVTLTAALAALVLWKHRANIGRLIRGEEKPISAAKKNNAG